VYTDLRVMAFTSVIVSKTVFGGAVRLSCISLVVYL
jgi:hypothetical protein